MPPSPSFQMPPHLHLCDFVDAITDDPSRVNTPNYVEIRTAVNIFKEDRFHSANVIVQPIHARIRAYLTQDKRDLYIPNSFFYADGRFSTAMTPDNTLGITVQALSLMRYRSPTCCPA